MSPIETSLDHLVVVASNLQEGVEFCEKAFGAALVKGGEHVRVGTHNYLLNLDDGIYLEVISTNPHAGPMDCPRWFGMDWPDQRQRAATGPYLATFVARTNDIAQAISAFPEIGPMRDMQRGAFEWQITIRDDGALVEGGTVPTVIQWPPGIHPTHQMPASGCRLECLEIFHPSGEQLRAAWKSIGLRESSRLSIRNTDARTPFLVARLSTPNGIIELR